MICKMQQDRMHVWTKPSLIRHMDEIFVQGQQYEICNFIVQPFTVKYKCLSSFIQIILTEQTVVRRLQANNCQIPLNVFRFTELKDINNAVETDKHLIGKCNF